MILNTFSRLLGCIAVLSTAVTSHAGTTTWTNPDGGAWTNPRNWTLGVPGAGDTAVLPAIDADGYTVELPTGAAASELRIGDADGGGVIALHGGSLAVSGLTRVGTDGDIGTLRLSGCALQSGTVQIGIEGGHGTIELRDGSTLGAVTLVSGLNGTGVFDLQAETSGLFLWLNLHAGSTVIVEAALSGATPGAAGLLLAAAFTRGGDLVVTTAPSLQLPTPVIPLLSATGGPATGSFAKVTAPILNGYELTVEAGIFSLWLKAADPVIGISLVVSPTPAYAGFQHSIAAFSQYISGQSQLVYPTWLVDEPSNAYIVTSNTLQIVTTEPFLLSASYSLEGFTFTDAVTITATDELPFTYERVSATAEGTPANGQQSAESGPARWTPDGRYVVFASLATNLVEPDPAPQYANVFVKDRMTGAVELVDVDGDWGEYVYHAAHLDISDDGRYVTFARFALMERGPPVHQVWLRDRWFRTTIAVSRAADGSLANGTCFYPRIAGGGTKVVYASTATNIVSGTNGVHSMIVSFDIASGTSALLSAAVDGAPANGPCEEPTITADGTIVAFDTQATNLVDDRAGSRRIVLFDAETRTWSRVDVSTDGVGGNGWSLRPDISADGRFISFDSNATSLIDRESSYARNVFVRDLDAATTTLVSGRPLGGGGNDDVKYYGWSSVSDDGEYVAFVGKEERFFSKPFEGVELRRVRRSTLQNTFVAVNPWGQPEDVWGLAPQLSPSGDRVLFAAHEKGLLPNQTNYGLLIRSFAPISPADLDHNGTVNAADLAILLGAWGGAGVGDINGDGVVGAADLAALLGEWSGQ